MSIAGKGVLAFWHDVAPGGEAEFDQWHLREHIPERVAVPGFLRCRRYTTLGAPPRYFYFYETGVARRCRPAYLARLADPTPWTGAFAGPEQQAHRLSPRRERGLGPGRRDRDARARAAARARDDLRSWLTSTALPAAVRHAGVLATTCSKATPA
jgi:hypothetical protein